MKVLHVILGKADKNRANGVNQVIAGLAKYSAKHGVSVTVLGKAQTAAHEGEVIQRDGFAVTVYTKWNRAFRTAMHQAVMAADVVHLHGTYAPLNIWVGRVCERHAKPYVVTLHAGIAPARISLKNFLQKQLFHMLLQRRHLERAALIQALTEEESTEALAAFRPKAMCVIPNGVDLEDFPNIRERPRPGPDLRIGYIGRIAREKNLGALCEAFAKVNTDGRMRLLLAGPASAEADVITRQWGAAGVELVGPKFGADKLAFLDDINLFVHPSKSDVFSLGAMEALARGVPAIISRTSDTSHFADTGAFVLCEPTAFGIERAMRKALDTRDDWPAMARRGRRLIETRLNWDAASTDLVVAYQNIRET
ncbi:glycosyltransferase [Arsenicitalea aurantiaca]|uniref:glycosyltransferase n=1 Tax=Arsenicitalea aurantiaca TaxID=1783274 RepID=UPI001315114A|nr:glycosyltransferase [Arsenicitalea aurantiaca]